MWSAQRRLPPVVDNKIEVDNNAVRFLLRPLSFSDVTWCEESSLGAWLVVDGGRARYSGSCSSYVKFLAHVQKKKTCERSREGRQTQTQRKKGEKERERGRRTNQQRERGRRKQEVRGRGRREACGKERSASGRQQFLVECWKTARGT